MKYYKLKELCVDIIDCPHSTPEWKTEGIRVVRNFNLKNGQLDFSDGYYVDEETYIDRTRRAIPEAGDIIISREAPMGVVAIIPEGLKCCLGQRLVLLKVDKSKINPMYLLFVLMSNFAQTQFRRADATGSIVSNLCIPDLKEIIIPVASENTNDTASILSAINDKIANNNAICAELEAMAKVLYDYWFVQFDFPDENGRPYKSSGGKMVWNEELKREIPEGWEACNIGEILQFQKGKIPYSLTAQPNEENQYPYLTIDVANGGMPEFCTRDRMPFCNGETIMVMDGAASGDVYVGNIGVLGSTFAMLIPKRKGITNAMIYWVLRANQLLYKRANTGSTVPHANRGFIEAMSVCIPRNLQFFTKAFDDIQSLIVCAKEENRELASLRDFLLPMLMNGQVSFKEVC